MNFHFLSGYALFNTHEQPLASGERNLTDLRQLMVIG